MTDEMNLEQNETIAVDEELAEETDIAAEAEELSRAAKGDKDSKKKLRRLEAENLELQKKIDTLTQGAAEQGDKYLRLAAEYDNYRRRSKEEQDRIYGEAYAAALAALFPVVDNLERASQFADGENVAKGVAMTLRSVAETLEKLGVKEIEAQGKAFDPQYHNAVLHVEDPAFGESEVVEVLQKGYIMGERVLRYAMVKVAN